MLVRPSSQFRLLNFAIQKKYQVSTGMIGLILLIPGFLLGLIIARQATATPGFSEAERQVFAAYQSPESPYREDDQIEAVNAQLRWPCLGRDNGFGTVDFPVETCKYIAALGHMMQIVDGLPPGDTIDIQPTLHSYANVVVSPGGSLGGEIHQFDAVLSLDMTGTGGMAGFSRNIDLPVTIEIHSGPHTPWDPVQTFPADLFSLQSAPIFGDPDFDNLVVTAGTSMGLPSPGQVSLTKLPDGNFAVDSFFDITYRIDFVGAPGSFLDGLSGSTTGTVRMEAVSLAKCIEYDVGIGTVYLPPVTCGYEAGPQERMMIIDGLPPGTTIEITPTLHTITNFSVTPGGTLGGEIYAFDAYLRMEMVGTGSLVGYNRDIELPVQGEIHAGPHTPGDPIQVFPTDFFQLQGSLFGDPDFDTLTLTAGTGFGLPSPGSTTLTKLPSGDFAVDSFFDISYRIDFVGAPGSVLEGLSGSTTGVVRWVEGRGLAPSPYIRYLPLILK
jgi:hypothetical protein